jgi:hypothetical protein
VDADVSSFHARRDGGRSGRREVHLGNSSERGRFANGHWEGRLVPFLGEGPSVPWESVRGLPPEPRSPEALAAVPS